MIHHVPRLAHTVMAALEDLLDEFFPDPEEEDDSEDEM